MRLLPTAIAGVLFAVASPSAAAEVREVRDIAYGSDPLQTVDVYLPAGVEGRLPTVVYIHGGGWREGDKREGVNRVGSFAPVLVEQGFVAVACNYRLLPKDTYPAQVDDVQRMIRWLRRHAEDYHIDPDRIGVVGISAGGHLAAMLATRTEHAAQGDELDAYSSRVQAAVSLAGVHDFSNKPEVTNALLEEALLGIAQGDASKVDDLREELSPIRFVSKESAPLMLVVGTNDTWIPIAQAEGMADALRAFSVETEIVRIEGAGHGIFPYAVPEAQEASLRWMTRFLK
ncbi:MAG: alpha/beta hydrolase [Planctomycetaceae bacterium]|nr:alpha/beta hydrolase [Planctomycetaceae bacterium]